LLFGGVVVVVVVVVVAVWCWYNDDDNCQKSEVNWFIGNVKKREKNLLP